MFRKPGCKVFIGLLAVVLIGLGAFYGPVIASFAKQGFFDRAPEKRKYEASRIEHLKAIHTALLLYHDSEGQFPLANGWMDAIENRLATNDLKKGEAEKKLHRPDLTENQYGYAINQAIAGKYKDDVPASTPLVFESKSTERNASGIPPKDADGSIIGIDGEIRIPK
jgi:hypothetical protein